MGAVRYKLNRTKEKINHYTFQKSQKISEYTLGLAAKKKNGDKILLGMDILRELDRPNFRNFFYLFFKKLINKKYSKKD